MKKFLLIPFFAILLAVLSACAALRPPEFHGATYTNPAAPPNFSLPSTQGGNFTLNEHTGKVVLLFFGYTYCPDVCPATMGKIKTALTQMSSEESQNVEVVFVTIDPERDTLDKLGEYLGAFNLGFVGAVPTLEQLEQLKADYGIVADKLEIQPDGSYLMAHTGLVYVLDKQGHLRLGFFDDTTAESMVHDLEILLKE